MAKEISPTLVMAGGMMWVVIAVILIFGSMFSVIIGAYKESGLWTFLGILFCAIGILFLFLGIIALKLSQSINNRNKAKKSSIFSLIIGILGLNVLVLMGGIIGLLENKKK